MASISLTLPVSGTQITAGLHSTNYGAIQTAINGGLDNTNIASGAAIAPSKLAGFPSDAAKVLMGDGTWPYPPGHEFAYNEFTSGPLSVTATTEGSAQQAVASTSVTFDGATSVWVEFFSPVWTPDVAASFRGIKLYLFDNGSSIGQLAQKFNTGGGGSTEDDPVLARRRLTPSAGAHVYSVRAAVTAGTGQVHGGAGGTGALVPAYIRVEKA